MKHTPGPWSVSVEDSAGRLFVIAHDKGVVARVTRRVTVRRKNPDLSERDSNARLIAAAPEILEALEDAMAWFTKLEDWSGVGDPDIEKYQAAIEKAEGKR